jgi:diadenosine tetraphosphate (Ap4A) HIT family hydrolase
VAGWGNEERWKSLLDGSSCWTCASGPAGIVIAETSTTWATTRQQVPCRGYLCLYTKRHVVEPYDLDPVEMAAFFADLANASRAVHKLFSPAKLNYEIHGNTNPHLHVHVFPRYLGDPFEGGPIRPSELHSTHTADEITQVANAVRAAFAA